MDVSTGLNLAFFAEGAFYILLFVFTLHALFLAYHWFSYGTNRKLSLTALSIYLFGGAILFLTFAISLNLI